MATIDLTKETFDDVVTQNDIVIVDFWAPWCGPCRSFGPVFEAVSDQHTDIVFGKVNADEQQELAGAFNIRSIPHVMIVREKIIVFAQAGALPPDGLESILQQTRALDMEQIRKDIAAQEKAASVA